jgi:hypothetical protein
MLRREWDDSGQWTPKNKYLFKKAHANVSVILEKMSMAIILDSLLPSPPPPAKIADGLFHFLPIGQQQRIFT